MKTDSTFWDQLGAQIDQYKKRAKINLENYEKQRFNNMYKNKKQKTLKTSQSLQQNPVKLGYSMNLIRQWKRDQIQKTQMLKSRFNFIKTQRDRKIQSSQRVRHKLEKVMSIRSMSSYQKSIFQQEIKQYNTKVLTEKRQLTQRAKSQRRNIQQERKKILSRNSYKASQVRQEAILNQETILHQKQADLIKRKKAVQMGHQQYEDILKNKKTREQTKIQQGRQNHFNHIHQQYLNYQRTKKLNQSIFNRFQKQTKKIISEAEQAHKNLVEFQKVLMIRRNPRGEVFNKSNSKFNDITQTNYSNVNSSRNKQKKVKLNNNFFHLTN